MFPEPARGQTGSGCNDRKRLTLSYALRNFVNGGKVDNLSKTITTARVFLDQLKANNNRDWFNEHKKEYEAAIKTPGTVLGNEMAARLTLLTGKEATPKLFRINRDIRFSKDKTPYNTHLHLLWSDGSGPAFFFGLSPDYVTAGCGVMGLQKERLDAYRRAVDLHGDQLSSNVERLKNNGYRLDEPELKRVPAPFEKDHPHGQLLKRKSLALWYDLSPIDLKADEVFERFEALMPIYEFCQQIG